MICDTENCNNEATHTDRTGQPICKECVDTATGFGESDGYFKPIFEVNRDNFHDVEVHMKKTLDSQPATTDALTVFEESLTEEGLSLIKKEAADLPEIAKTEDDYTVVYDFSTRLKRLRKAVKQKEKTIQKELKEEFKNNKSKIAVDLEYVIGIVTPLIEDTITARDYMECWIEALKERRALALAATAETERNRIHIHAVYDYAHAENAQLDDDRANERTAKEEATRLRQSQAKETERLETERATLARERYEFDCERSRLSIDDAWTEAFKIENVRLTMSGTHSAEKGTEIKHGFAFVDPDINELAEFAKNKPAEPVETKAFADILPEDTVYQEMEAGSSDSILYSTNPAEKEKQLLELAHPVISEIKRTVKTVIDFIDVIQADGFESKTATTATRRLIEDIQSAADRFTQAVTTSQEDN